MEKTKKLLSPENLDLEQLITTVPPQFSHTIDGFKHIIDLVLTLSAWDHDLFQNNFIPFVNINAIILQKALWNYDDYMRYLISNGVLECDNHFVKGEKSKGYRLTPRYRTFPKEVAMSNFKLIRRILNVNESRNEEAQVLYGHLIQWFEGLEIDSDQAEKYLLGLHKQESKPGNTRANELANLRYASRKGMLQRIADRQFAYVVDRTGHRFHTVLTNLKSELRQFLTYKGQPLVSIDICNSQPYLSTCLFDKHFYEPIEDDHRISVAQLGPKCIKQLKPLLPEINTFFRNKSNINNNSISSFTCSSTYLPHLRGLYYPMLVKLTEEQEVIDEFNNYKKMVQRGNFYEYMQEHVSRSDGEVNLSRKEVKEAVLTLLFSDPADQREYFRLQSQAFRQVFPTVADLFTLIKSSQYNTLAVLLQSIESELVLNQIVRRISEERPDLPLYTIHDSCVTTAGNEVYVETIMREELERATGLQPKFKPEYWKAALNLTTYQ